MDCASFYKNEEIVGEGIQRAISTGVVKREELFVVSKVWPTEMHDIEGALERTLGRLGLEYVDLYLLHWPVATQEEEGQVTFTRQPLHVRWAVMEGLVTQEKARSIGVSNHNVQLIADMLTYCQIRPAVNQVELNPFLSQRELVAFLEDQRIVPVAFYPIVKKRQSESFDHPTVLALAEKHKKSSA